MAEIEIVRHIRPMLNGLLAYRPRGAVVEAVRMHQPFRAVRSDGAVSSGADGDFLMFDIDGEPYAIDMDEFAERYEKITEYLTEDMVAHLDIPAGEEELDESAPRPEQANAEGGELEQLRINEEAFAQLDAEYVPDHS